MWQVITIFSILFALIILSTWGACHFMKTKNLKIDSASSQHPHLKDHTSYGHHHKRLRSEDNYSKQQEGQGNGRYKSDDEEQSSEDYHREMRVPRAAIFRSSSSQRSFQAASAGINSDFGDLDNNSGINVPLLDQSEGTVLSQDGRSSY